MIGLDGLAGGIRRGERSAADVVAEHLARMDRLNGELNAVVARRDDAALAEAREVDRLVESGADPGRLCGVPFTVKDTFATEDLPTTCGSRALAGHRTAYQAAIVARLRAAGAILVGKTNTPEFAFGVDTVNDLFGRTRNPLGPFTPGGSSGGEAAAVAAGMSAFGIGSDFGGSVRWPAQCTGLVGLRPTAGLLPAAGHLPEPEAGTLQAAVQVVGPLTRSVADAATVLGLSPAPRPGVPGGTPSGVRVWWAPGAEAAAERLAAHGLTVIEGLPEVVEAAADLYSRLRATDSPAAIRRAAAGREDLLEPRTRRLFAAVPPEPSGPLWAERERLLGRLRGRWLLALPVATAAPFVSDDTSVERFDLLAPCRAISLFGIPAISVPYGRDPEGRPRSVQLAAPANREDLLLAAATLVERS